MWPDGKPETLANGNGRVSSSSEVVIMDERILATAASTSPNIAQVNVTESTDVHVGPKFVSINQTVHNREVIKDLPLPKYLWSVLKSTTKAEKLSCAAAIILLAVCVVLIVVYATSNKNQDTHDDGQREWYITRTMWLAKSNETDESTDPFEPLRLVVVQHTAGAECYEFKDCAAEMRQLQDYCLNRYNFDDIGYNFVIGNDGRVYEGRGWGKVGAHTKYYNRCSIGVGFMGDYREEIDAHASVTPMQINRTHMLLEYGVKKGYLHPNYQVLAARDIQSTASPGSNLYNELRSWKHYYNGSSYINKTCEQMYALFKD